MMYNKNAIEPTTLILTVSRIIEFEFSNMIEAEYIENYKP